MDGNEIQNYLECAQNLSELEIKARELKEMEENQFSWSLINSIYQRCANQLRCQNS